jgi:hypothetical protein
VLVPPNMSDNPLPLPECIRIVTIRNRDDGMSKTMTTELMMSIRDFRIRRDQAG